MPSVAGWRLSGLPKGLEPGQLRRLLAGCDRRTRSGRRDYAILLLLSRLGLRAGEIAAARVGRHRLAPRRNRDPWQGSRAERLPLPADVGAAIAAYLRHGRPATAEGRSVFVRVNAPHRALTTGGVTNGGLRRRAAGRAAQDHAHRLRHTAATAMLRAGARWPRSGRCCGTGRY